MSTATAQNTFDHMIGSGALSYPWWQDCDVSGESDAGEVTPDWHATLKCADGIGDSDSGTITGVINHAAIMRAATDAGANPPRFMSNVTVQACRDLVNDADACDFDAPMADELLQYMIMNEIVYG